MMTCSKGKAHVAMQKRWEGLSSSFMPCAGGRRGAAGPESMVVTCSDGEVVTVNLANGPGLDSVPARYRKEVTAQLEALRKLATAALTNVTKRR